MKKAVLKGAVVGSIFSAASFAIVKFLGYRWESLTALMYMYVVMGVIIAIIYEIETRAGGFSGLLDRIVLVAEDEHLHMKKLFSGEKYRIKGEVEKL